MPVQIFMRIVLILFLVSWAVTIQAQQSDAYYQAQYAASLKKLREKKYTEAVSDFTRLINGGYPSIEIFVKRGVCYYQLNDLINARSDFDKAEEGNISTIELYEHRGYTKFKLKQFRDAVADFQKAMTLGAGNYEIYYSLGVSEYEIGLYQGAVVY